MPSDVDWQALARRIASDAAAPLGARRHQWWDYTANWARAAVSVGIAAAVTAAFVLAAVPTPPAPAATLLSTFGGGEAPARTFESTVIGLRGGASVIAAAVGAGE